MVMVRDPHMDHHTHTHGVRGREEEVDGIGGMCVYV